MSATGRFAVTPVTRTMRSFVLPPPPASQLGWRPMSRRRRPSRTGMTKVLTHMCMSLDGFVARPDGDPAGLFDWYWDGDVVVPSAQEQMRFSVDAESAPMLREIPSGCGALIAGRRL